MMVDAVCIDLDGTLLDTIPDLAAAANAMLADLDIAPLPVERIRQFVGKGAEVLIERALDAAGVSALPGEPDYEAARVLFYANYRHLNGSQAGIYPGVVEGLDGIA